MIEPHERQYYESWDKRWQRLTGVTVPQEIVKHKTVNGPKNYATFPTIHDHARRPASRRFKKAA